jgi:hypothetical protein
VVGNASDRWRTPKPCRAERRAGVFKSLWRWRVGRAFGPYDRDRQDCAVTTFFDFVPSNTAPFEFQPTLDGQVYTCGVTWGLFGRRFYISCYQLDGTLVFSRPVIGSPAGLTIEDISWDAFEGVATAVVDAPHGYAPGSTVRLTVSGASPDAYNGVVDALVIDPLSFTYTLASAPGPTVSPGNAFRNINIAGGYFDSVLVYRTPNRQFEVSP